MFLIEEDRNMGRQENIDIFEDTKRLYETDASLVEGVGRSTQNEEFVDGGKSILTEIDKLYEKQAKVIVSDKRSFEAAAMYAYQKKKVCVLNFASATNPGGGVTKGSSAQEEALCRISTLYPCLSDRKMMRCFYYPHRDARNPLHNDDAIYTPDVVVFKSDTQYPRLLSQDKWYKVNVITSAAPNLRQNPSNAMNTGDGNKKADINRDELLSLLEKRIHRILEIARGKGNEVIILGAFGCGAFINPPQVVAEAMKSEVEKFRNHFDTIEVAVYCPRYDDTNYQVFKRVLGNLN